MWATHPLLVFLVAVLVTAAPKTSLKVGFIYVGPISDFGYTYSHDQGRIFVQDQAFFGSIQTDYVQNVPEANTTYTKAIINDWINKSYDVIIGTSFGFQFPMAEVAAQALADGRDTKFVSMTGYLTGPNLATAFAKIEQARYLNGMLAGYMTKSDEACFIGAFSYISEVVRAINAFAIGFREVRPNATVYTYFINSWADEELESEAARRCHEDHPNADVYTQHVDGLQVGVFAASVGAYSIGYNSDMRTFTGESVLTSSIFKWGPLYEQILQTVYDDTWVGDFNYRPGLNESVVALGSFSNRVPPNVTVIINNKRARIAHNHLEDWYCHPTLAGGVLGTVDAEGCLSESQILNQFSKLPYVVWVGNVTMPPPEEVYLQWNDPVAIAFMTISAIGILICVFLMGLVLFWKNPWFKASSVEFLILILFGTMIGLASVFLLIGNPVPAQCQAFLWLIGTAFAITYGSILVKTYRITVIFYERKKLKKIAAIPLWQLFSALAIFLLLEWTILIVWTAVDYPTIVYEGPAQVSWLTSNQILKRCHWVHYEAWLGAFLGYMGFLIVLGSILSWLSRKIHIPLFNESKHIGLMMYNLLVIGAILVAIAQTTAPTVQAEFAIYAVLIDWIALCGLFLLFAPKIYGGARGDDGHSSGDSGASAGYEGKPSKIHASTVEGSLKLKTKGSTAGSGVGSSSVPTSSVN